MALSENTKARILNGIKLATDTLAQLPVTYQRASQVPNRFANSSATNFQSYNIKGLYVESKNQTDTVVKQAIGAVDLNDGYFIFNFEDLNEAGLAENGLPIMKPTKDYLEAFGLRYEIIGVVPVAQLVDKITVVKVIVKKIPERVAQ